MERKTFGIHGMKCSHCKATVEEAVKALPGVAGAEASVEEAILTVGYDPTAVDEQQIADAVAGSGRFELTL